MRTLPGIAARLLAGILAYLLAAQPVLAGAQAMPIRSGAAASGAPLIAVPALPASAASSISLFGASLKLVSGSILPAAPAPSVVRSVQTSPAVQPAISVPAAVPAAVVSRQAAAQAQSYRTILERQIAPAAQAAAEAVRGIEKASDSGSRAAADAQFSVLTGERRISSSDSAAGPVAAAAQYGAQPTRLQAAAAVSARAEADVPPPAKKSFFKVLNDPERNQSFWRYLSGYAVYIFGIEMYVVGLPFLVSALVKNSLRENHDPRAAAAETVQLLVRQIRNNGRKAHWVGQAFGYLAKPLFKQSAQGGLSWLWRSFWV
ncbi:MAG: hypothetical protein WC881_11385, partial [Elusimicrobiota bacterium]